MKLNAAEIREIEKFLTAREKGLTNAAIGAYFGLGDFGSQKASTTFKALASIGVRVVEVKTGRKPGQKDTTKRKQRGDAGIPRVAAKPITPAARLSAEQWQERLSAAGF